MIKKFILAFLLLLPACAHSGIISAQGVCRHDALYCAVTVEDTLHLETRIVIGENKNGRLHAQAQTLMGGKWIPLRREMGGKVVNGSNEIAVVHNVFTPEIFLYLMNRGRNAQFPGKISKT